MIDSYSNATFEFMKWKVEDDFRRQVFKMLEDLQKDVKELKIMADKQYNLKQCLLRQQRTVLVSVCQTSWIPEKFAINGKNLELYDSNNNLWEPWVVDKVYDFAVDYEYIRERSQDYKRTRKASDI